MLLSSVILGWIGILLFFIIILTFRKLTQNNEFGFLHILMAFMYAMWLPLPLTLNRVMNSEILKVGTIFGMMYLNMLVITMVLQAGHIIHFTEQKQNELSEEHGNYMMATLSNPFEAFANIFKCIWALFLAIAFWNNNLLIACVMFLFSLLIFYFIPILLNASLVKKINPLLKIKANLYFINLETFSFFFILVLYITFQL